MSERCGAAVQYCGPTPIFTVTHVIAHVYPIPLDLPSWPHFSIHTSQSAGSFLPHQPLNRTHSRVVGCFYSVRMIG